MTTLKRNSLALLTMAALALSACSGKNDTAGTPAGPTGPTGPTGPIGPSGVPSISTGLEVAVTSVSTGTGPIQVRFTLKDDRGYPVDVAGKYSVNLPISLRFSLSSVSEDASGNVLPYTVLTNSGATPQPTAFTPSSAGQGTLVENGTSAGDYTYSFPTTTTAGGAQAVAYDPAKLSNTHVVWIQAARQTDVSASSTGATSTNPRTFTAVNAEYDYIPSGTGTPLKREIVKTSNCSNCHRDFKPEASTANGFHGSGRVEAAYCNVCHNPGRTSNPAADSAVFIHRIHKSETLQPKNVFHGIDATYPQDIRNCDACHGGAAQGAQWTTRPSRAACGSCHDYVSFTAAATLNCTDPVTVDAKGIPLPCNHIAGTQADDKACAQCHVPGKIPTYHVAVVPPDPNNVYDVANGNNNTNAAYLAAAGTVPTGATQISYLVKSVSAVTDTTVTPNVLRPQMVFKLQRSQNGMTSDVVFNTYAPAATPPVTEMITGFIGSPSVYWAYSLPQDGIAAPADFNASQSGYIKNIWNRTATTTAAGTMTGPDASGFYTITLGQGTTAGSVIPAGYKMLTGGVGYTYGLTATQPLTQVDLPRYRTRAGLNQTTKLVGGLIVPARDVWMPASTKDARRPIVDNARCNTCHVLLGAAPTFHAGQRNDGPTCSFCHNPNQSNNGWSGNAKDFIHGIHAGTEAVTALPDGTQSLGTGTRSVPFGWHALSASEGYWSVAFPGPHNNCEACHLPGTSDFAASASAAAVPNLLWSTAAAGSPAAGFSMAPYVKAGTDYGAAYGVNKNTGVITPASANTLVTSPIVAACVACHDAAVAVDHMQANGGQFYAPRSAMAAAPLEQCLLCHGTGGVASIANVHK